MRNSKVGRPALVHGKPAPLLANHHSCLRQSCHNRHKLLARLG